MAEQSMFGPSSSPAKRNIFQRGVGAFSKFLQSSGKQIDKYTDKALETAQYTQAEAEALNKQVPHVRDYGQKLKMLGAIGVALGSKDAVKVFQAGQKLSDLKAPVKSESEILELGLSKSDQAKIEEEKKKRREKEARDRANRNRSSVNRGSGKKDMRKL